MGGSSSIVKEKKQISVKYVSNVINNILYESISNVEVIQKSDCISSNKLVQRLQLLAGGNISVTNLDFSQAGLFDSKCSSISQMHNDLMTNMFMDSTGVFKDIEKNSNNSDIMNSIKSEAATLNLNSNYVDNNITATSNYDHNIETVIKNSIVQNFKLTDLKSCIATLENIQDAKFVAGGDITLKDFTFKQQARALSNCILSSGVINKVVENITSTLNLSKFMSTDTENTSTTGQSVEQTGFLGDLFRGAASTIKSMWLVFLIGGICLLVAIYFFFKNGGGDMIPGGKAVKMGSNMAKK
ncbi:putative myristylated IMV envelope protein [Namao virus]|nr:putative myristylated IMV envelope protein [Namao virus]